jgi:hypothetical protein
VAIWQFDIELVPASAPPPVVTDDLYETAPLPALLVARATRFLTQHFGAPWEMLPNWLVFGEEDGHRFDVHIDDGGSGSIRARVDARVFAGHVLPRVRELAQLLGCNLYLPELNVSVEPTKSELKRVFRESAAARFVQDPQRFFEELS